METNAQVASVTPIRTSNVLPPMVRSSISRAIAPHLKEGTQPEAVIANIEAELMKSSVNSITDFAIARVREFFKK